MADPQEDTDATPSGPGSEEFQAAVEAAVADQIEDALREAKMLLLRRRQDMQLMSSGSEVIARLHALVADDPLGRLADHPISVAACDVAAMISELARSIAREA